MFLLDTNTVSAIAFDATGPAARRLAQLGGRRTVVNVIVVGELLFGLDKRRTQRLRQRVEGVLSRLEEVALEPEVGPRYAALRLALERTGTPIGANDLWIAAHALTLGATLVTANEREFRRVDGLRVENWTTA